MKFQTASVNKKTRRFAAAGKLFGAHALQAEVKPMLFSSTPPISPHSQECLYNAPLSPYSSTDG